MITLAESYAYCRETARARAKNFYYSFVLLRDDQRDAMCAMYSFMRYCDDLSDESDTSTIETMDEWRADLTSALAGKYADHPVWPAFHDAVKRYNIPHEYFHAMIDGVSSDLTPTAVHTFDELYQYCYRVASVVGLTIVHIFGFKDRRALELAEKCGIAFQLTNILRDVREDFEMGRIYLPSEDLKRFGVSPSKLQYTPEFVKLMRFEAARAFEYYKQSMPLIRMVDKESRASLWALIQIYYRLLQRIEAKEYRVLERRVRLSTFEKVWLVIQAGGRKLVGAY